MDKNKIIAGFHDESPVTIIVGTTHDEVHSAVRDFLCKLTMPHITIDEVHEHMDNPSDSSYVAIAFHDSFDDIDIREYITLDRVISEGTAAHVTAVVGVVTDTNAVESIAQSSGMRKRVLDNSLVLDCEYAQSMYSDTATVS